MKKIITILLLAISGLASAQTYQLNYPDIRIGSSPTGKIVLRGSNIQFPFLALGNTTDSVLTIAGGQIKKVPRSQFSGGGTTLKPATPLYLDGDSLRIGNGNRYVGNIFIGDGEQGSLSLDNNSSFLSVSNVNGFSYTTNQIKPGTGVLMSSFGINNASDKASEISIDNSKGIILRDSIFTKGLFGSGKYWGSKTVNDSLYYAQRGEVAQMIAASGGGSTPDTTVYRTVSNSFTKAQTNTQISNALTGYVPNTRTITAGNGLTGGGDLSANRTLTVDTTTIRTVANSYSLAGLQTKFNNYLTTASATTTYVPKTLTLTNGYGINSIGDLSANRTISVDTTLIRTVANSRSLAQIQTALNAKQNTLVSGTNIKTINGNTILGSGDLVVSASQTLDQVLTAGNTSTQNATVGGLSASNRIAVGSALDVNYISKFTSANADNFNAFTSTAGIGEYGIYQNSLYFQALSLSNGVQFYGNSGTTPGLQINSSNNTVINGSLNLPNLTATTTLGLDASKNVVSITNTGTGNAVRAASPTLTGTPLSTTAAAKTNTTQIATTAFSPKQFTATGSGTGSATSITVAHGVSGVTSANSVVVTANNAAAGGLIYATLDATNVTIFYSVAPASGTNNLAYSISIR